MVVLVMLSWEFCKGILEPVHTQCASRVHDIIVLNNAEFFKNLGEREEEGQFKKFHTGRSTRYSFSHQFLPK